MPEESQKAFQLENILFQLLDYQSRQGNDHDDTMLMLGLVNLFGIVSVMNKQAGAVSAAAPQGRGGGMDPLVASLLSSLGGGPHREQPGPFAAPGAPGINPALLMNLISNQAQTPEQAMLMHLLAGMMNRPQPGRPGPNSPGPAQGGWAGGAETFQQAAGHTSAGRAKKNEDDQYRRPAQVPAQAQGGRDEPPHRGGESIEQGKTGQVLKWDPRLG